MKIKIEVKTVTYIYDMYQDLLGVEIEPVSSLFPPKLIINRERFIKLLRTPRSPYGNSGPDYLDVIIEVDGKSLEILEK